MSYADTARADVRRRLAGRSVKEVATATEAAWRALETAQGGRANQHALAHTKAQVEEHERILTALRDSGQDRYIPEEET